MSSLIPIIDWSNLGMCFGWSTHDRSSGKTVLHISLMLSASMLLSLARTAACMAESAASDCGLGWRRGGGAAVRVSSNTKKTVLNLWFQIFYLHRPRFGYMQRGPLLGLKMRHFQRKIKELCLRAYVGPSLGTLLSRTIKARLLQHICLSNYSNLDQLQIIWLSQMTQWSFNSTLGFYLWGPAMIPHRETRNCIKKQRTAVPRDDDTQGPQFCSNWSKWT